MAAFLLPHKPAQIPALATLCSNSCLAQYIYIMYRGRVFGNAIDFSRA